MKSIYQGETAKFLAWLTEDNREPVTELSGYTFTITLVDRYGHLSARFSNAPAEGVGEIKLHDNGLLSFGLTSDQTAHMLGDYTLEIKVAYQDTVAIERSAGLHICRSTEGQKPEIQL